MPKNIEKRPPQNSKGGQISKKWKRCDVRQKILSGHENVCHVLSQKSWRKKKRKKEEKTSRGKTITAPPGR